MVIHAGVFEVSFGLSQASLMIFLQVDLRKLAGFLNCLDKADAL